MSIILTKFEVEKVYLKITVTRRVFAKEVRGANQKPIYKRKDSGRKLKIQSITRAKL